MNKSDTVSEKSKLMTPLFYEGSFNREGRRMRAVFERQISNGTETYWIWRSAGKPDQQYPRAENDKYLLYVEINSYLLSIGMSDFALVDRCGSKAATKNLYGSNEERERHFDNLRKSGNDSAVLAALKAEEEVITRYGSEPARQAEYIHKMLNEHVNYYLEAKENGGQTFPDFVGALLLNDLAHCAELSNVYMAKKTAEQSAHRAQAAEKEQAFCVERNKKAEQAVADAIQTIRGGGVLKNTTVEFYRSRYDFSSYSIINYLMRLYQVDVPLRTQGWINSKLANATIKNGTCQSVQYFRAKNGQGSQKFFECMNDLIQTVTTQLAEQAKNV